MITTYLQTTQFPITQEPQILFCGLFVLLYITVLRSHCYFATLNDCIPFIVATFTMYVPAG